MVSLKRMHWGILLGLSLTTAQARSEAPVDDTPAGWDSFLKELQRIEPDLLVRIDRVSARLLGRPYLVSPLGEGRPDAIDPDPRFRLDGFDCTTFIETVWALARSDSLEQARGWLDQLRYRDGVVSFETRNHFMLAQWVPQNTRRGFVEDVTPSLGIKTRTVAKTYALDDWRRHRIKLNLPLKLEARPVGTFRLPVIPAGQFPAVLDRIPGGAILNVVRYEVQRFPVRITHQGFLIRKNGKVYFRHASDRGRRRVKDTLLETYLRYLEEKFVKWPVEGFNVLLPRPVGSGAKHHGDAEK